ncbi:hypothetical protein AB0H82_19290 [Streptomyces sp. NPDC050732]|uniref:hypothetical protein n=1 Tax=Streptomyces sp. NPDC050732 TaxID=3154632 RepID=UPI00343F407C
MTKPQNISSLHPVWRPGDVVLDADGNLRVRTEHTRWPWDYPNEGGTRSQFGGASVPEGGLEELEPIRPLTLLVREGHAVGGHVAKEEPPAAEDITAEARFRMHGATYRVAGQDGQVWRCRGDNGLEVTMTAEDIAAWKAQEYSGQAGALTERE